MPDNTGYSLRFPFKLPQSQEINNLTQPYEFRFKDKKIQLKEIKDSYFFKLGLFSDEAEGESFIPKIWAGLMWVLLHLGMAPTAQLETQKVAFTNNPYTAGKNLGFKDRKIDGICNGDCPAIYKSDKDISAFIAGSPKVTQGFAHDKIGELITEALSFPYPEKAVIDNKLSVALDLYNAFFWESSPNARFLTLNMALEALSPQTLKHQCAVGLVSKWMSEVDSLKSLVEKESEEWHAYDSLKREIGFRKEASIRSSIRHLVFSTLSGKDSDAENLANRAVKLYDLRSSLVHDGHVPGIDLSNCICELRVIATRVIRTRFLDLVSTGKRSL